MSAEIEVAVRYRQMSDAELLEFSREGPGAFEPYAWDALQAELARRDVEAPPAAEVAARATAPDVVERISALATSAGETLTGVGGWLALFVVLSFIGSALNAAVALVAVRDGTPWQALVPAAFAAAYLWGLRMIGRRDPRAPSHWRVVLAADAVLLLTGAVALGLPVRSAIVGAFIRVAWLLYWETSARVRATFAPTAARG